MLSRACQYGILTTVYLANHGDQSYVPVRVVAEELGLSNHFLAKIVQQASSSGIFQSYRGPNGGVALGRASDRILLRDIVEAIDGMGFFEQCVLGLPGCGTGQPCPMHSSWSGIRAELVHMLETTTVRELSDKMTRDGLRLSSSEALRLLTNKTNAS